MGIESIRRQSTISLTSTLIITFIGFLSTMFFAHVLGPEPMGAYFLFVAYFGVFNLLGDGGLGRAAVKRISEDKHQSEFFTAFIILRMVLLVSAVLLLIVASSFLVDLRDSGLFVWLIVAMIVGSAYGIVANGVYGRGRVGNFQMGTLLNNVARIVLQVIAVFLGYGAAGLAGGFIAGMVVGAIFNWHALDLHLARFQMDHIRSLFAFSFWIFLAGSGFLVFTYADTILVGYFLDNYQVGIYRVALQFTTAATFITMALHTVLFPKMSHWSANGEVAKIETALSRAFTFSLLLALPVCAGGWVLGEDLLIYLYGAPFAQGAIVLAILLVVQVANVFMYLQTMCLNAIDRPKDTFRITAIAVGVNIGLNVLLIPWFGIVGAAVATLSSIVVNAVLAYHVLGSILRVTIEVGPLKNILVSVLAMMVITLIIRNFIPQTSAVHVLLTVLIGGVVFALFIWKLDRGIRDEIMDIVQTLKIPWPKWL
jgi:O-antigen/teichoic acid export membrane protein